MNKLLIIDKYHKDYVAFMAEHYPTWQVFAGNDADSLQEAANECEIWFGLPNKFVELLKLGVKQPKWMQSTFAGIAPLMVADLPKNYILTRAVGVFDQLMAEYVLTYMLANERQMLARYKAQQKQYWLPEQPGTLHGKQVLIVGAGTIGTGVANFLKPFGVRLTGIASCAKVLPPFAKVGGLDELSHYVAEADYIINLLPDTPKTHNIYSAAVFAKMKPTAVFINSGRGAAIVDEDLVIALDKGRPKLAVLDVFRSEPLPENHLFWRIPNILITEHTAAISTPTLIFDLFSRNLQNFTKHQPMLGQVDFSKGY